MLLKTLIRNETGKRWFSISSVFHGTLKATIEDQFLIVKENNEKPMKFPNVWLRDNCQCSECFHCDSQSRQINWEKFNLKTTSKIRNVCADYDRGAVKIDWSDKHHSFFELDWLKARCFDKESRDEYLNKFYRPKATAWSGKHFEKICKNFDFKAILNEDNVLEEWLQSLATAGITKIQDAPLEETSLQRLIDRVGYMRKTYYGDEFIVQAKPGAKNFAYQSSNLQLHTDLPYYEYKVGVNLLHCMVQTQSEGGNSLFSDGLYIADRLRKDYAEEYRILRDTMVNWNDIGQEQEGNPFHLIFRSPLICEDREGTVVRINYSVPQRDSHFSVDLEKVIPWYEALSKFVRILHEEAVSFKMNPGEIIAFNNLRVMHGRTEYNDVEDNVRYIIGAYIDWDVVYSKLRILKGRQPRK